MRVQASSVNPVDNAIAAGMLNGMFEHDFRSSSAATSPGSSSRPGPAHARRGRRRVRVRPARRPAVGKGTGPSASVAEGRIASRPSGVDLAAAGATPLAGVTALSAVDALSLKIGESVLIVGATGGVGSFAVQMAGWPAPRSSRPASRGRGLLRGLGAAEAVARDGDVAVAVGRCPRRRRRGHRPRLLHARRVRALRRRAQPAAREPPVGAFEAGPGRFPVMAPARPGRARLARRAAEGTAGPIQRSYGLEDAARRWRRCPRPIRRASSRSASLEALHLRS